MRFSRCPRGLNGGFRNLGFMIHYDVVRSQKIPCLCAGKPATGRTGDWAGHQKEFDWPIPHLDGGRPERGTAYTTRTRYESSFKIREVEEPTPKVCNTFFHVIVFPFVCSVTIVFNLWSQRMCLWTRLRSCQIFPFVFVVFPLHNKKHPSALSCSFVRCCSSLTEPPSRNLAMVLLVSSRRLRWAILYRLASDWALTLVLLDSRVPAVSSEGARACASRQ